ncbi:lipocalin family protein [Pseudonocardia sp. T1-2H]|uniref:lipocalin family protein n=1 Tax=Pseudonocardia sp. T1-2H TaxID=3128899 RepID=UPI00310158EE
MTEQGGPSQGLERDEGAPAAVGGTGMVASRRAVLGAGLALAATACTPASTAPASTAPPGSGPMGLQTGSAQRLYTLPADHQWHGGGIYDTGLLEEWFYWTGFLTDVDTQEQFGLFYNLFHEGDGPGKYSHRLWFSLDSLNNDSIVWATPDMTSFTAAAAPQSTSPNDFLYSAQGTDTTYETLYRAEPDTWSLKFHGAAANVPQPVDMAMELHTTTPYGYMPLTPYGVENENMPWTGQTDPTTMSSLSYYYGAPKTAANGAVKIGNQMHRLQGSLWMEHQWGNFRITEMPWAANYIWSGLQFDDGSIFTFRQWYGQNNQPLLNLGRHSYSTPNNQTTYGFGQSVVFTPLKTWTSPVSKRNFPVYASVSSEFGTWYYSPVFPDYEMPFGYPPYGTSDLDIWEAPCLVHTGSLDGPVVGKAYLELPNILTKTFPVLT